MIADATARPVAGLDPAHPVVVELFQSQGCSSCPPANANVNALATEPGILALNFSVTYWDRLGWKDTFAQPGFTQRQWDYAKHAGRPNVATPQVIVNGAETVVGGRREPLVALIERVGPPKGGPALGWDGKTLAVGAGKSAEPAIVWLVRYDPEVRQVAIKAGENDGRTLPHRNIVRELVRLGSWRGQPLTLVPAPGARGLANAVLVQSGEGGPIIAARTI